MSRTPLSRDTVADAEAHQLAAWRALGSTGRLLCARQLSLAVRRLEAAGLATRQPALGVSARARLLARRHLGAQLAAAAYGTGDGGG